MLIKGKSGDTIEYWWGEPKQPSSTSPAIILVHGHMKDRSIGGHWYVRNGIFQKFMNKGFYVISISQPGYGSSTGNPDFYGPRSQMALTSVIRYVKSQHKINSNKLGIIGQSRGAALAALVAAEQSIAGLMTISGPYNLVKSYETMPTLIKKNLEKEADCNSKNGCDVHQLKIRSAFFSIKALSCKVLVLHGEKDRSITPYLLAKEYVTELKNQNKSVSFHALPNQGHLITPDIWFPFAESFFTKLFSDNHNFSMDRI